MNEYYKEKLEQGLDYQDFVVDKLYEHGLPIISYSSKKYQLMRGENKAGLEIKNDMNFRNTGNLYIETAEKSKAENLHWIASGIFRADNTWLYLIGDKKQIFVFGKCHLIMAWRNEKFHRVETKTSQGFLLPVDVATSKYSIKIIEC